MKPLAPALMLLLLLAQAAAAQLEARKTGSLKAVVESAWAIEPLNDSQPQEATLAGLAPSDNSRQKVSVNASSAFIWSENKIVFNARVSGKTTIAATTLAEVDYQGNTLEKGVEYPFKAPDELKGYTRESPLVLITPEISDKARELAGNSSDALEILARLVDWTHNNVEYDGSLGSVNYSSAWVFANRRGTCDEYSHLLIAFGRSLGIPARFVSGYINTGKEWGMHGWAEFWLPEKGWIPADPAFNEMLVLDATHIKLVEAVDQSYVKESINWSIPGSDFAFKKSFSIREAEAAPFRHKLELENLDMPNQAGSVQEISVEIKNPSDEFAFAPVRLILPQEATAENAEKLAYLKPLETKKIQWNASLPRLQKNMLYTFPVIIETQGAVKTASFQRLTTAPKPVEKNLPETYGLGTAENIPTTFKLFLAIILVVTVAAVALALWQQRQAKRRL